MLAQIDYVVWLNLMLAATMVSLGCVALLVSALGVFGYLQLKRWSKSAARSAAAEEVQSYLVSDEHKDLVKQFSRVRRSTARLTVERRQGKPFNLQDPTSGGTV